MRIRLILIGLLFIFAFSLFSQQSDAPKGKSKPNAAADSEKSKADMEKAKKLFGYDCAMCHGETGDGKGDLSADYAGKIKDLTDPATLKDVTDEEIFTLLKDEFSDIHRDYIETTSIGISINGYLC